MQVLASLQGFSPSKFYQFDREPSRLNATQIFNVAKGRGLAEAEKYLGTATSIEAYGSKEALIHWNNLHSHPQSTPQYVSFYDDALQKEFDGLYHAIHGQQESFTEIDWDDDKLIQQTRRVFDTLGERLQARPPEWCRRVGVSMRLYARLPISIEGGQHGPTFSASSALPAKRWLERVFNERGRYHTNQDGLVAVSLCDR